MGEASEADDAVKVKGDPLNWVTILNSDSRAQEGMFSPYRKTLLEPEVFVNVSRMTAESWVKGLREVNAERGKVRLSLGMDNIPEEPSVRVTILEIPETTRNDAVDGKIKVEADGVEAWISASVFYNCIKGPDRGIDAGHFETGGGWSPPPPDFTGNMG